MKTCFHSYVFFVNEMELKSKSVFERSTSFTSFQNFVIVFVTFSVPPVGLKTILYLFILHFLTSDLIYFSFTSNPLPATIQNGRVAGLVVSPFRFPKIIPKYLTSNSLFQIVTSRQPSPYENFKLFLY